MKKMLFAGAAALAALVATGAQAASTETGWYGALDAGVHKTKPITSTATDLNNTAIGYDWNWGTEQSWAGFARLGYRMTPHVRVELEGGYRQGNLSSVLSKTGSASIPAGLCAAGVIRTSAAPTCGKPSGHINRYTVMLNGLYDPEPHVVQHQEQHHLSDARGSRLASDGARLGRPDLSLPERLGREVHDDWFRSAAARQVPRPV